MRLPRVYPILDTESLDARAIALETAAAAFLDGGAGILQIRHKRQWSRGFFASARPVARLCREAGATLVVNDRADFALLLEAGLHVGQDDLPPRDARRLMGLDCVVGFSREAGATLVVNDRADFALLLEAGLHVGQDDLPPRDARRLMGPDCVVGFSSHNVAQLCTAGGEPVDSVALGPVFPTASKLNPDPVTGIEEIRRCRPLVEKPLVAIGGITLENALEVFRAGADSRSEEHTSELQSLRH